MIASTACKERGAGIARLFQPMHFARVTVG